MNVKAIIITIKEIQILEIIIEGEIIKMITVIIQEIMDHLGTLITHLETQEQIIITITIIQMQEATLTITLEIREVIIQIAGDQDTLIKENIT